MVLSVQRQRYVVESEYLLDLCLQNGCRRLIVGTGSEINHKLFGSEGVSTISQQWQGSATLRCVTHLDAIARLSPVEILRSMEHN